MPGAAGAHGGWVPVLGVPEEALAVCAYRGFGLFSWVWRKSGPPALDADRERFISGGLQVVLGRTVKG